MKDKKFKILVCPLVKGRLCCHTDCAWWDEDAEQCAVRRLAGLADHAEREDKRKQGEAAINFDKLLKRWVK